MKKKKVSSSKATLPINFLQPPPDIADPWEHVLGMGLGAVFVNQLVKWDAQLKEDLDKMLEKAKAANERRYFGIFFFFLLYYACLGFRLIFFCGSCSPSSSVGILFQMFE